MNWERLVLEKYESGVFVGMAVVGPCSANILDHATRLREWKVAARPSKVVESPSATPTTSTLTFATKRIRKVIRSTHVAIRSRTLELQSLYKVLRYNRTTVRPPLNHSDLRTSNPPFHSHLLHNTHTYTMGSVVLPHLRTGWHVDQAILSEEDRLVLIRFGRDSDPDCMSQDEVLYKIADRVKNFCAIYLCDLDEVPDFKAMYELYDPCTVMFFFRNKHMMCDFGTGNNNKLNWVLEDKQEFVDIIETVYRGAKKGRGLVVSPKDYSTRYRY